jgi:hypothetical protein
MIKVLCGFAAGVFYGTIVTFELLPTIPATIMKFLLNLAASSFGG